MTTFNNKTEKSGVEVIKSNLRTMPQLPGVYRMIGADARVLYVGKAKNLKNRVKAYSKIEELPKRLQQMVINTHKMEIITTKSENEAFLLESDLIKNLKPKYNILLKDDKSFPYILITEDEFPRIVKFRGIKSKKGIYFGPFPSAHAVNQSIKFFQEIFLIRSCRNSYFKNRTRPCMLYQIKRCSAPCVSKISKEEYLEYIKEAEVFFKGEKTNITETLVKNMNNASKEQEYEKAAYFRDKIEMLKKVQMKNRFFGFDTDTDVVALYLEGKNACIDIFFFRNGLSLGNKTYFFNNVEDGQEKELLKAFFVQFYSKHEIPKEILVSHEMAEKENITQWMEDKKESKTIINYPKQGAKKDFINQALLNAKTALDRKMATSASQIKILKSLQGILKMEKMPEKIECFDNSHIQGKFPVGAMIVAGKDGFIKKEYRKFNIKNEKIAGDDFAMMREVLTRRYKHAKEENSFPDLVLVDGGKGQLSIAKDVVKSLNIRGKIVLAGVAKGKKRNAGDETIYLEDFTPIKLDKNSEILFFIQRVRDEAHRFVITFHRKKREKNIRNSPLDNIEGIGKVKKKALLNHFGSVENIKQAKISEIIKVSGINKEIAKKIFSYFR